MNFYFFQKSTQVNVSIVYKLQYKCKKFQAVIFEELIFSM